MKKNLIKISLLFFGISFITNSCKKKDIVTLLIYEGCCGTAPFEAKAGNYKVSIPNVFTPNADGINDCIVVYTNDSLKILDFTLKNFINTTVWQKGTKTLKPNECLFFANQDLASIPEGSLTYTLRVQIPSGEMFDINGSTCKNTNRTTDCPANNKQCVFPDQISNNGSFDRSIPTSENCK